MKQKIFTALSFIYGLWMINAGLNKFFNYLPMPEDMPTAMLQVMEHLSAIVWLMPLVAVVEILGGILLLLPKTRTLGATMLFTILVGIVLLNLIIIPSGLPVALVFFAANLWVLWEGREKITALWS